MVSTVKEILRIRLSGHLRQLVKMNPGDEELFYPLTRRASLKDIIESLNIPHTEIGRIMYRDRGLSFRYIPHESMSITVLPFTSDTIRSLPNELWPACHKNLRFIIDKNVLKLGRLLRMAGIDTALIPELTRYEIGYLASEQERIILTRDRELVKCGSVVFGQLLRSTDSDEQFYEVVKRFQPLIQFKPFCRCMECNGVIQTVDKKSIIDRLKPLTRKYYNEFSICRDCQKLYWKGSHYNQMAEKLRWVEGGPKREGKS